jgi:hypothetical protein
MALYFFNVLVKAVLALIILQIGVQGKHSSDVSKAKAALKSDHKFCRKFLHGDTYGVSTVVDTIQTTLPTSTKTITSKTRTTDATFIGGTSTRVITEIDIHTQVDDVTVTTYTAATTDYYTKTKTRTRKYETVGKNHKTKYLNKRAKGLKKSDYPKTVRKYSDSVILEACYMVLYGKAPETSITATTTKTVTSKERPVETSTGEYWMAQQTKHQSDLPLYCL